MRCGEIWARLIHERARLTQFIIRPCREHGDGRLSTPYPCDDPLEFSPSSWPDLAVQHEFLSNLELAERELAGQDICASPGVIFS